MAVTVAYQTLLLKRSNVAAHIPQTTDLSLGEMAINTNDGRLFIKKNNGSGDTIIELVTIPYLNSIVGGTNIQYSAIQNTPTTLAGYGIIDAASKGSVTSDMIGGSTSVTSPIAALTGAEYGVTTLNTSVGPAIVTINRNNSYIAYLGLDTDNVLKIGGGNMGAVSYPIYHGGNQQQVAETKPTADNSTSIATTAYVKNQGYATLAQAAMPGQLAYFASSGLPNGSGWLVANGAAISRTAYSALFAVIGTYYGGGDGSTTFNIPDLRGVFIRGWDAGRGLDPGRGFGNYQGDQFGWHGHSDAGHQHGTPTYWADQSGFQLLGGPGAPTGGNSGTYTGYANIQGSGGNETVPKNYSMLACIKY